MGGSKAPGPLHAFFVRIRARRGHQVAAVAVARKLTVLIWHMLTKQGQLSLGSLKSRRTQNSRDGIAGRETSEKGNKPGPAYAYNVKKLRDQEAGTSSWKDPSRL